MLNIRTTFLKHIRFCLAIVTLVTGLTSCGGGNGNGGVGFADGQTPDPVVVDVPIAYVKRPIPVDENNVIVIDDAREPVTFNAGADLFVRDRASPTAFETNITFEVTEGFGDVKDVEINSAGSKLVFALREPMLENVDDDDQPSWNIWEYTLETAELRRIIGSDINAEAGHDVSPAYLPDGRIVFSSTRQRQSKALLLDEGKPQFSALDENENVEALVLHVMNEDGSDIHQISFNQSHDLYPVVTRDGKVVFSRWGAKGGNNAFGLFRANPDGSAVELLYGANSGNTGSDGSNVQFLQAKEMPDGRIAVLLQPFQASNMGGQISLIDTTNFIENQQATAASTGMAGPAQVAATINNVRTDSLPSRGGRYSSFYPLWDGTDRLFVSWSQCRLQELEQIVPCTDAAITSGAAVEAPPIYGIWVYDRSDNTQLPVVAPEEGIMYTDIVAAQPKPLPAIIFDQMAGVELDAELVEEGVGLLHIRSVYDFDGVDTSGPGITALADPAQFTAQQRAARFIRIVKGVSIPDDDLVDLNGSAFGRSRNQGMREIIGYAPVEPDGSVKIKVPADAALAISVLDKDGKRIGPRHQAWITLRAGEEIECHGCHDPNSGLSHGRNDAFTSVNAGSLTNSVPFPNTEPALFAEFGETMAQTRARISCATDCASLQPAVDFAYTDVWTDEVAAQRAKDASFLHSYQDLQTALPVSTACINQWSGSCRTVIHYETHIHPLWGLSRQTLADDGVTVLQDYTCTSCHSPVDDMAQTRIPLAQLDLSDGVSADNANQFISYRELLFNDNEQELEMGALQDRLIQVGVNEETMEPIFDTVSVSPSMNANGATASTTRFFSRFEEIGVHAGYLSASEVRLIAEWLDIGGQYYNDPFAVPQN